VGYHSLTTTTHSSDVNLPSSGQHITAWLSARTVSVARGNRAKDTPTGQGHYSLAQQYVFKLIKPGYMFQQYSHHQAYLQSLVELYMLNVYAMWDPSKR
jgi:hypothetical protein